MADMRSLRYRRALILTAIISALFAPVAAAPAASHADDTYSWTAADNSDASYNWAGYIADTEGSQYTAVSGSWTVPAVSAQAGSDVGADAAWVGIGGVSSEDLIQAGTQALVDGSGNTQYEAWYELLPDESQPVPLEVSAGDTIAVLLKQTATGVWEITFTNETTGKSYDMEVSYDSSLSSAEWIQEMPSSARGFSFIPLDNFNTIVFDLGSTIENGKSENLTEANASPLQMINVAGQTLAQPSVLSQNDSFEVMRTQALASAGGRHPRHEILQPQL